MSSMRSYASAASGKDDTKNSPNDKTKNQSSPQNHHKNNESNGKRKSPSEGQQESHNESSKHRSSDSNSSTQRGRNHSSTSNQSGAYTAKEYIRAPRHIPNTRPNRKSPSPNGDKEDHYILTLLTDQSLHDYMTSLRKKYFPAHINKLDAHVTLFHALPGSKLDQITTDIENVCSHEQSFPIATEDPYSPRMTNIMVRASSPKYAIEGVQKTLREKWNDFLSEQDSGGMKPHWTLMNKVDDKKDVEKALAECKKDFKKPEGSVNGLVLWRYDRGHWRDRKVFEFAKK